MGRLSARSLIRILLTALVCLAPIIAAYRINYAALQAESDQALQDKALRRADRLARSFRLALNDAIQAAVTSARLPSVSGQEADCDAALSALVMPPSMVRVFAVGDLTAGIVCASDPALKGPAAGWPGWVRDTLRLGDGVPHALSSDPRLRGTFLPVSVRLAPLNRLQKQQFVIIGIDPAWIVDRIDRQLLQPAVLPGGQSLLLVGRDGSLLMGLSPDGDVARPAPPSWLPQAVPRSGVGIVPVSAQQGAPAEIVYAATDDGPAAIRVVMPAPWETRLSVPIVPPGQHLLAAGALLLSLVLTTAALWRTATGQRRRAAAEEASGAAASPDLSHRTPTAAAAAVPPTKDDARLTAGLLHKLNNGLATVQGNLDLLERLDAGEIGASATARTRFERCVTRAAQGIADASAAAKGLLALTRDPRQTARPTDMNALIGRATILAQGADVSTQLAPDLWPAMVQPSRAEAALLRLCLDAREMLAPGESLTITSANVPAPPPLRDADPPTPDHVAITFTFPATAERSLFGWDYARLLSEAFGHGATTELGTCDGRTRLVLLLPRATDQQTTQAALGRDATAPSRPLVLVVDDDDAVRRVTTEMLSELDCEVTQASDAETALRLCRDLPRPPDLALIDHLMPGMRGTDLARRMQAEGLARRMVLVTGYADIALDPARGGALEEVLRKPFAIHELRRLVAGTGQRQADRPFATRQATPIHTEE
jgi:CheY-like chemotaxis protein